MKETKEKVEWDKKKIIIFVILLIVFLIGLFKLKSYFLDQNTSPVTKNIANSQSVKGASITTGLIDIKKNVQDEIANLKNEASNINLVDIATSSPQVQKVINDLKALQNYPNDQLKSTCINICSKL